MARVMNQMPLHDITFDISTNPEILLMMAEHDESECDVTESYWTAGQAVTPTKSSNQE